MYKRRAVFLCGADYGRLETRSDCPNTLHDWPLPAGYCDASEVAAARLKAKWKNKRCPSCGLFGWVPGNHTSGTHPNHVGV